MHRRVRLLGGRKGRFSPLTSALRHYRRNAFPSQRLPAAGRFQSVPSATYRTRLRHYAMKSRRISPRHSSDVHAAPNLDQPKKEEYMFDAVGLVTAATGPRFRTGGARTSHMAAEQGWAHWPRQVSAVGAHPRAAE